jgi:N-acetylmuramoyl-L-alanine amidase
MDIYPLDKWLPSSARPAGIEVDTIVMHATAGTTWSGALRTLWDRELSYHYGIEDQREVDGRVWKGVPISRKAWHAGKSVGPHGKDVNRHSIGITLVNANTGFDPYSEKQYASSVTLIRMLIEGGVKLKYLTSHALISPGRKTDPLGFPIKYLAADTGLELWRPS